MLRYLSTAAAAAAMIVLCCEPAWAASSGPADAVCHDPVLTRQEQDLCIQQIAAAQSVPEQKAIQTKFRDRVAAKKKK